MTTGFRKVILCLFFAGFAEFETAGVMVNLQPTDDANVGRLWQSPDVNSYYANGSISYMDISSYSGSTSSSDYYGFLKFDFSTIPLGSIIESAVLHVRGWNGSYLNPTSIARMTDDSWTESAITWNNKPSSGAGLADQTGWTTDNGTFWMTRELNVAAWSYGDDIQDDALTLRVTRAESSTASYRTSEYGVGSIPYLELSVVPEPGTASLLLLGGGGLLNLRRRSFRRA